jgi:hypothetical protein
MRNERAGAIAALGFVIIAGVWGVAAGAGTVDASRLPHVAEAAAKPATENAASAAPKQLEAEGAGDLPVPTNHSGSISITSSYRRGLYITVSADVASVLAFYRRELDKRGWKEQPGAEVNAEAATVAFASPNGPAALKLAANDDGTSVSLFTRDRAKAEKNGVAPKQDQAKIVFENGSLADAVFSVSEQTVKIAGCASGNYSKPQTIDLPPGKYRIVVEVVGSPAQSVETTVAADGTWTVSVDEFRLAVEQVY